MVKPDAKSSWALRSTGTVVKAVVRRLEARADLDALAREILQGLADAYGAPSDGHTLFAGESAQGTICAAKGAIRFECAKNDFACEDKGGAAAKFACISGVKDSFECGDTFSACAGDADKFDCVKDNFDCGKDAFDCHDFNCGQGGKDPSAFDCNEKVDFLCGGPDFDCLNDFDCTAGHAFLCLDDHECQDSFGCSATGNTKCDKTFPYSRSDDGGVDKTPGDFLCGVEVPGGGTATFDCTDDYDCTATNEFDCAKGTDFDCAATFDCGEKGGKTRFECDSDFDCQTDKQFSCVCAFAGTDKSKDK